MKGSFATLGVLLAVCAPALASDEAQLPDVVWNGSFDAGRAEAASRRRPFVVLFYDLNNLRLQDRYDRELAESTAVRETSEGFVFAMVDRAVDRELARRFDVRGPWELRVLAPDGSLLHPLRGKPAAVEVAKALRKVRDQWAERERFEGVAWMWSYEAALSLARSKHRPLMLYFWSDERKGTHPSDQELFRDERIVRLSKKFVCVSLNRRLDGPVFEKWGIKKVPALRFVTPDGEPSSVQVVRLEIGHVSEFMEAVIAEVGEETVETQDGGAR